jgi:hypothetical protein
MKQLSLNTIQKRRIFEFDIDTGSRKFRTWVYSDTGLDIEDRFKGFAKVTNIKEQSQDNDKPTTNR